MFVKYTCASHYSLTGPEHVYCQGNRLWTQLPNCKGEKQANEAIFLNSLLEMMFKYVTSFLSYFVPPDSFCVLDPDSYRNLRTVPQYLQDGARVLIPCVWIYDYHEALVQCRNKVLTVNPCKYPSLCFSLMISQWQ